MNIRALIASAALLAIAAASIPAAQAGVATGTLSVSLRIVDSCDVRTRLPPSVAPATATATGKTPVTRSSCNTSTPSPRVTITDMPNSLRKEGTSTSPAGGKVKLVTIYF